MQQSRLLTLIFTLALASCGGGGDEDNAAATKDNSNQTVLKSIFYYDGPVYGNIYAETSSADKFKIATRDGFECIAGESVSFWLGDVFLGQTDCAPFYTPYSLSGADIVTGSDGVLQKTDLTEEQKNVLSNIVWLLDNLRSTEINSATYIKYEILFSDGSTNELISNSPEAFQAFIQSQNQSAIIFSTEQSNFELLDSYISKIDLGVVVEDITVLSGEDFTLNAFIPDSLQFSDSWWRAGGYDYMDGPCSDGRADSTCVLPISSGFYDNGITLNGIEVSDPVRVDYVFYLEIVVGQVISFPINVYIVP